MTANSVLSQDQKTPSNMFRTSRALPMISYCVVMTALLVIWLAQGAAYFWVIWPAQLGRRASFPRFGL